MHTPLERPSSPGPDVVLAPPQSTSTGHAVRDHEVTGPPDLERLRAEIAARLRPVCPDMAPWEFELLVRDVVAFKVRWAAEELPARFSAK